MSVLKEQTDHRPRITDTEYKWLSWKWEIGKLKFHSHKNKWLNWKWEIGK